MAGGHPLRAGISNHGTRMPMTTRRKTCMLTTKKIRTSMAGVATGAYPQLRLRQWKDARRCDRVQYERQLIQERTDSGDDGCIPGQFRVAVSGERQEGGCGVLLGDQRGQFKDEVKKVTHEDECGGGAQGIHIIRGGGRRWVLLQGAETDVCLRHGACTYSCVIK